MWWNVFYCLLVPLTASFICITFLCSWLIIRRLFRRRQQQLQSYPKIGIIVPHYNENPEYLLQSLEAIEEQDYPGQLVVVLADDGSTNDVQSHLEPWLQQSRRQQYISIKFEKNNGSKGKNMDAALPYFPDDIEALVVVDSDTYLEKQSVRLVTERMWQDDKCAAVCGFIVPANERNTFWQKVQYFEHIGIYPVVKNAQDVLGMVSIMAGAFVIHRMSVVREIGGWGDWIVEDIAWTWKALASGYRTGYVEDALAYTYNPSCKSSLFNQRRRWARGRVEAYRVAVTTSPFRALYLCPLFILYIISLLPPMLCFLPILAFVLEQWWVFALMGLTTVITTLTFVLYQKNLPSRLQKGRGDFIKSLYYNSLFGLFLWRPNVLGFIDEVFGKTKSWLTR